MNRICKYIFAFALAFTLLGCSRAPVQSAQTQADRETALARAGRLSDIPKEHRTKQVLIEYLNTSAGSLGSLRWRDFIKEPAFDTDVAHVAIFRDPKLVLYSKKLHTAEFLGEAFGHGVNFFYADAEIDWDEALADAAFAADPTNIHHIPSELVSQKMIRSLIDRQLLSEYAGDVEHAEHWTPQLVQVAWRVLGLNSYPAIPERYRTYEMAKVAVTHDGRNLGDVPWKQRFMNRGELCRIALMQTDAAAEYVPEYFKYGFGTSGAPELGALAAKLYPAQTHPSFQAEF